MLTLLELVQLERSYRTGKALTVYLDGRSPDPAQRTAWRRALNHALAEVRDTLHDAPRAEREAFARCVEEMEESLAEHDGALRARGWVGFFPEEGVAHTEALPVDVPLIVAWGDGIRVAPYIRALKQHQPAIVALVDSRMARVHRFAHGMLEEVETLRAHAHVGPAEHMGYPPRQGFHTGTRGSAGSDASDRELRAATADMLRTLADRLTTLAGSDGWILLAGIPEVVSDAMSAMPIRLERRVRRLEHLDIHATRAQIAQAVEAGAREARREYDLARVTDLLERHAAGGHGVAGFPLTHEALHEHAVETLYFSGEFLAAHPGGAELLVRAAFDERIRPEYVSGPAATRLDDEAGGVGASLRFVSMRKRPPVRAGGPYPAPEVVHDHSTSQELSS
ncbi:MAG TPA: hypothetical protein VFI52_02840 [Gemmatimonadaceae bacterium]|nr:hypothetical protein [Gemmatimonadaceae bacterium]